MDDDILMYESRLLFGAAAEREESVFRQNWIETVNVFSGSHISDQTPSDDSLNRAFYAVTLVVEARNPQALENIAVLLFILKH